jgi:Flp pilus assembly protein TadB
MAGFNTVTTVTVSALVAATILLSAFVFIQKQKQQQQSQSAKKQLVKNNNTNKSNHLSSKASLSKLTENNAKSTNRVMPNAIPVRILYGTQTGTSKCE